jgi:hypothetical protein
MINNDKDILSEDTNKGIAQIKADILEMEKGLSKYEERIEKKVN